MIRFREHGTASIPDEEGMMIIISADGTSYDLEHLVCDVLRIQGSAPGSEAADERPVAARHLTFGLEEARHPLLTMTEAERSIRGLLNDKRCYDGKDGTVPFSFSVRTVNERTILPLVAQLRPLAVLHTEGGRLQGDIEVAIANLAGSTVSINIPQEDLEHAGWILSLPAQALRAWNIPKFKAIVITNDRASSLRRLLKSLETAHYFGDDIDLSVRVEASADAATIRTVKQATSDTSSTVWQHGRSDIFFRFRQAGLICNIVEAWYPTSDDEYAFFFEDDIEASPFFFAWAKWAILTHRYGPSHVTEPARNILGVSLIQQMTSELDPATGRIVWSADQFLRAEGDFDEQSPYLSQVPSSWGAVYFPEQWREFHDYIQVRDGDEIVALSKQMVSPSLVSDMWEGSWKRYIIELIYLRGYTMLYPNYVGWQSLSTNHVELGEHINPEKQAILRKVQEVPLMTENLLLDVPRNRLSPASQLPVFDLWGKSSHAEDLVTRGINRHKELWQCNTSRSRSSDFNGFALFACT